MYNIFSYRINILGMIKMKEELIEQIELLSDVKNNIHNKDGILLNLYKSGSDLYGWRSKDSDIDYRGLYQLNPRWFLGNQYYKDVAEMYKDSKELDVVLFEVRKAIDLALKGNCNMIEEFVAEQIYMTVDFLELQQLMYEAWNAKGLYGSYKGLAMSNYKKFILGIVGKNQEVRKPQKTVKKYLYVFRDILAGRYAMDNGMIEPNMSVLLKYYRVNEVKELLKLKKKGKEKENIPDTVDDGTLDGLIVEQFKKLDKAYVDTETQIKPTVGQKEDINKWLVDLRKEWFK